jgi:hypothetical protein
VAWSTIRLFLTLVSQEGWATRQVDFINAFAQEKNGEAVFVEPPKLFVSKNGKNLVLKLLRSWYGLKQAPRTFFEKLDAGLCERGFTPSKIDPCLFMKAGCVCVVYVDDTIFAGPDAVVLAAKIKSLGVPADEHQHSFKLCDEGGVGDFLGICIAKQKDGTFLLTQTGLISKVIDAAGMNTCNKVSTSALPLTVGADLHGDPFDESWEYASIIGMLVYLAANTRPDIAYAVHRAARHTHHPQASQALAIKRIVRYLQGTKDGGTMFKPDKSWKVDYYVDSDFAGLYKAEHDQDPVSAKSRTGYVIKF